MNNTLQTKLASYSEEQKIIKNDDMGLVVSYAKTHWPEVKKTLSSMFQATVLAQGVVGLLKINKHKVLNTLSKVGLIYANIVIIKEQHEEGLKNYRNDLLNESGKQFYKKLTEEDKDEIMQQSRILAGIYHDRDSKSGLKKFRKILELWGQVFHAEIIDEDKFLKLVDYLVEYHQKKETGKVNF